MAWVVGGAVALALLLPARESRATTVATGDIELQTASPASVEKNLLKSDNVIRGFFEIENLVLHADVEVDFTEPGRYVAESTLPSTRPRIPAGTTVSSFFLHSDRARENNRGVAISSGVTFDTDVLGVMVLQRTLDQLGDGTDAPLGADGTRYPVKTFRGLELSRDRDFVELSADRRTLTVKVNTVEELDQIRVLLAPRRAPEGSPEGSPPAPPELLNCGIAVNLDSFIQCFYNTVLDRAGAAGEVATYAAFLTANQTRAGASVFAHAFLDSPERLNQRVTVADQVTVLYRALLGREPDPEGLAGWVSLLVGRYNTVVPGFVGSAEFRRLQASTSPATLVTRLYENVLGRTASEPEVASWLTFLGTGGDYVSLAIGFLNSEEYLSQPRTLAEHVTILYRTFLGREPDVEGLGAWVNYLAVQYGTVEDAFIGSDEFQGRFARLF